MLNGYFDILPRGLFTPYVGAGIGFVYNDIQRYRYQPGNRGDGRPGCPNRLHAQTSPHPARKTASAWPGALMGGISFAFDQRWVLDVNYRAQYLAGGSAYVNVVNPGLISPQMSKGTEGDHWEHQVRVGLRWNIW